MLNWRWNVLRWILAGGAVLSVLNSAGCSSANRYTAGPDASAGPSAGTTNVAMSADPAVLSLAGSYGGPAASLVNVYGEFDGVQRPLAKAHGNGGFQEHTFLSEGFDSDVSLDPTGKWMVFTSTRDSEHPNLYLQQVDGLSVIQLTNDEADYAFPAFSPDGKQIAFCSTRSGNWDIYVMGIDGKNIVQLTNDPMQHLHPSYSPDGGRLVYCCLGGKSGQWEIWTLDLVSSEKRMIGFGLFPSWSPARNVDRIVFQKARQRGSRWFSLWTLDLIDGEARRITEVAASTNAAIVCPTWSPDGKQIAFATIAEPNNSTATKPLGQQDIWTINCDGTNRSRITDGLGLNLSPCWSTDNRIYFVSDRGGEECVWSARSDNPGQAPSKVAADKPQDKNDRPTATDAVGSTSE
jgi:Tol biopolymer transport system component